MKIVNRFHKNICSKCHRIPKALELETMEWFQCKICVFFQFELILSFIFGFIFYSHNIDCTAIVEWNVDFFSIWMSSIKIERRCFGCRKNSTKNGFPTFVKKQTNDHVLNVQQMVLLLQNVSTHSFWLWNICTVIHCTLYQVTSNNEWSNTPAKANDCISSLNLKKKNMSFSTCLVTNEWKIRPASLQTYTFLTMQSIRLMNIFWHFDVFRLELIFPNMKLIFRFAKRW